MFQRGINRADIFVEDADYEILVTLIVDAAVLYGVEVHAFVLMTNHYHLVLTAPSAETLALAMARINGSYAKYYNRKYGRIGPLWNSRYGAALLDTERYWLTCLRYVEFNPVPGGDGQRRRGLSLVKLSCARPW